MQKLIYVVDLIDLRYCIGKKISAGKLIILGELEQLFVDARYLEECKELSPRPLQEIASFVKGLDFGSVEIDFSRLTHRQFLDAQGLFEGKKIVDGNAIMRRRMIKTLQEIKLLKESANLNWESYLHARTFLKEGVSEKEVAWAYESFARARGASEMAFEPIIAFGENSSMPHHRAGSRRLRHGDPVTMDLGLILNEYASDMTRSFCFGKSPPGYDHLLELVKEAKTLAFSECREGNSLTEIDSSVRQFFGKHGCAELFKHTLGHGVGLEVHEDPFVRKSILLQNQMALAIEPGLYKEGEWGIRLEDTILLTARGIENLYPN